MKQNYDVIVVGVSSMGSVGCHDMAHRGVNVEIADQHIVERQVDHLATGVLICVTHGNAVGQLDIEVVDSGQCVGGIALRPAQF